MQTANLFERAVIDVPAIYSAAGKTLSFKKNPFAFLYRAAWIPLSLRKNIWRILGQVYLDQFWFHDFKHYWSQVLGLRPMWGVEDFYFLRGQYRIQHQAADPDMETAESHVESWQRPDLIYFLLQQVYVESKYRPFEILELLNRHLKAKSPRFLEYGCGIASITKTIFDFSPRFATRGSFRLCDIKTLAFHYAQKRFHAAKNVEYSLLEESNNLQFETEEKFDAIFCTAVFEHLNAPLETVQRFHKMLEPQGLLFFDYVMSDADGLDTTAGLQQRDSVLNFIENNFDLLNCSRINHSQSVPLVLARKS